MYKVSYTDSFISFLSENKGYDPDLLSKVEIKSRGLEFSGVKVCDKKGKDAVAVQVFALMSEKARQMHRLYPFYRTQKWGENNENVYPSCSIAVRNDDGCWNIYDAHDSGRKRDPSYLNHTLAVDRYYARKDSKPIRDIGEQIKWICWVLACVFAVYLILRQVFPDWSMPLDGGIVSVFILIAVLILLPLIIPYLEGISFFGIDLIIRKH